MIPFAPEGENLPVGGCCLRALAAGVVCAALGLFSCAGDEPPRGEWPQGTSGSLQWEDAAADSADAADSRRAQRPRTQLQRDATGRRGLWVLCEGSQRVLENPERIPALLADAEALGVGDLFVQVYRGGRAWFPSALADAAPAALVRPPGGEDALARLIAGAHARGMRVHAWVNVLSLSRNTQAPLLRDLGRDAVLVDNRGRSILDYPKQEVPQPERRWFRMGTPAVWLDPAAPGVARRLTETFAELLRVYPEFDGLHLDYIRYADALGAAPPGQLQLGFGFGAHARKRFQAETGLPAPFGNAQHNAEAFAQWRRDQVTALVARAAARARAVRPGVQISAAVIGDRQRAYRVDFQDWLSWLDSGHLDFAVPLLYTRDDARFHKGLAALAALADGRREIWVGLGSWLFAERPAAAVAQMQDATALPRLGTSLFSWDSLREQPALLRALATQAARERAAAR